MSIRFSEKLRFCKFKQKHTRKFYVLEVSEVDTVDRIFEILDRLPMEPVSYTHLAPGFGISRGEKISHRGGRAVLLQFPQTFPGRGRVWQAFGLPCAGRSVAHAQASRRSCRFRALKTPPVLPFFRRHFEGSFAIVAGLAQALQIVPVDKAGPVTPVSYTHLGGG